MRNLLILALAAPLMTAPLMDSVAHADPLTKRERLARVVHQLRPIIERARGGQRTSIDIKAVVRIGGAPVVIEQNSDVNVAGVFQAGGGSTTVAQDGIVNVARVRQAD